MSCRNVRALLFVGDSSMCLFIENEISGRLVRDPWRSISCVGSLYVTANSALTKLHCEISGAHFILKALKCYGGGRFS